MSFTWGKFSKKQLDSILQSTARLNIWEGSVRSGKTIASIVRWLEYIKTGPPGDLLMVGKTERTLKRNILDVIESIVGTKNFKYNRGLGEVYIFGRKVYIAGANDERAEGKIRGMTLAGAYGDELTLWPESFFKMLLSRLSVPGAKLFGTTNPDSPYHWLKIEYIDNEELNIKVFHFELDDNPNLDPQYVELLKKEYTGLWYKRFILGLWVLAEGIVYDMFDESKHVITEIPECERYWVAIDYGTNNPTVFLLQGQKGNAYYTLKEYHYDSSKVGRQKTDAEYSKDLKEFIGDKHITNIVVDPSAASFIAQLRKDGFFNVRKANNEVLDGIRYVSTLLSNKKYFIHESCKNLIKEKASYVWDPKAQQKGEDKPLKQNDHCSDAERYGLFTNRYDLRVVPKPKGW
ncbi:PBSX family phage terminase large subunit [Thermoanaerobacteraceae bacterium SP2]|nr:PBSX family phage terminase large subunit [Thermoanaerobacteraceae bacterium SP2]